MAVKIQNLTSEANQRHTILFEESEIILVLHYHPSIEMWTINVEYKGQEVNGIKLSLGVLHMESANLPFDFVCNDTAGLGIDPFKLDDFAQARCELYMLESDDMETIRDAPVPI